MKAVFLPGAEADLRELRRYVLRKFGPHTGRESFEGIRTAVRAAESFTLAGRLPDELAELGLPQYRQIVAGMNRIIYETREDRLYIHIVCDTRRDLRGLLHRRLSRPS
ncbi:type II toxin-antitoxin system RelE/ParE family toxin [Castellaniella defragrans]|uniref:type II toxin-antitoxin system RelE/ParE family toxin n=1 Tax=Castellaniella defragrans TaxID=75697 RepID=UPI0023F0F538|nr:type II toxin-antitoxin system RelE/ParE family toxin [Castellaniella defragrans]